MKYFLLSLLIFFVSFTYPISNCDAISSIREFFFPPKDLFHSLVEAPIDISSTNKINLGEIKFKYKGSYALGISYKKDIDDKKLHWEKYSLKLRLNIKFYADNKLIFEKESTENYSPYWGQEDNGIHIIYFNYPKDISRRKLMCTVEVVTPDRELNEQYKPFKLFIRRNSGL
jgi:hypothetical protein